MICGGAGARGACGTWPLCATGEAVPAPPRHARSRQTCARCRRVWRVHRSVLLHSSGPEGGERLLHLQHLALELLEFHRVPHLEVRVGCARDSLSFRHLSGISGWMCWTGTHSARAAPPVRAGRPDLHAVPAARALAASMAAGRGIRKDTHTKER
eukprot:scaffold42262_cov49-Phaeocystis_antarctica.AAC.3